MVHRLIETTQIQIKDTSHGVGQPFRLNLNAKKPFQRVRQIRGRETSDNGADTDENVSPVFIVYDRYRFEIVQVPMEHQNAKQRNQRSNSRPRSRSLRRENSLGANGQQLSNKVKTGLEALQTLRQAGKIIHCSFLESGQRLCFLMADKSMATFDFEKERLVTGLRTPGIIFNLTGDAWDKITGQMGSLANKFSKGSKVYDTAVSNADAFDFELYQITMKHGDDVDQKTSIQKIIDCKGMETIPVILCSRKVGQQLIYRDNITQIVKPGYLATSFSFNKTENLNIATELRLQKINGKAQTAEFSYRCFVFQLDNKEQLTQKVPYFVKEERATFKIQLSSKAECLTLAQKIKQKASLDCVLKARVQTCAQSLTSVIVVETITGEDQQQSSYIFMIDVFKKQTVIDLGKRMHGDIPPQVLSLNSQKNCAGNKRVRDFNWAITSSNAANEQNLILMTLEDNSLVCFDQDGQQVKVLSDSIYGQNIIGGNFSHFIQRSGLQIANKFSQQKSGIFEQTWALHDGCLTFFDGQSFQSFEISFSASPFQKASQIPADLRRCSRIGRGFPMLTVSSEIVLDSKLFERNERVFWHMFLACKIYQTEREKTDILLYRTIFQGYNTIMYFMRYQEYILAFRSLILMKKLVLARQFVAPYEKQPSGKPFPRTQETREMCLFRNEKMQQYESRQLSETHFDKSAMLRQLAACLIARLIQVKSDRQFQLSQKIESQKGMLLPEQVVYEQRMLVQCFKLVQRIASTFFKSGKNSLNLRAHVAMTYSNLQYEKEKSSQVNIRKLKIHQKIVYGFIPSLKNENDPNMGRHILLLLIQSQKSSQGRLQQQNGDIDNFKKAVDLFKKYGLATPANEFLLTLQLLRNIQQSLNLGPKLKTGSQTHQFRTSLPSPLEAAIKTKGNEIVDLADLQSSNKIMAMRRSDAIKFGQSSLSSSFDLFFSDSASLIVKMLQKSGSRTNDSFDELLLLCQYFHEVKDSSKPTQCEIFRKLMQVFLTQGYGIQTSMVSLRYILEQTPGVIEPESNAFRDIKSCLFSQRRGISTKTTKYPKFISYLLQNINKMPMKEIKQIKLPGIPLDQSKANLNGFLLNALVELCVAFKCDFQINLNALLNAPTIKQGILEAMALQDKVSKSNLRNSKKIQRQNEGVDTSKEAIWEIILWLWAIQCQFMAAVKQSNTLLREQSKVWRVRHIAITRTLHKDTSLDISRFLNMLEMRQALNNSDDDNDIDNNSNDSFHRQCKSELESIKSIYLDQHQLLEPLQLISRALTDQQFSSFLLKLPSVFTHYSAKSFKQNKELDQRVKQRVQSIYWQRYCEFRENFGLKLNYSLKYEKQINLVQLVKRREIVKNVEQTLTIKQIERELQKENDTSFISEDPFNKSMTSQNSAFTLAHFNQTLAVGEEAKKLDENSLLQKFGKIHDLSEIEHLNDYTIDDKKVLLDNFSKENDSQKSMQNVQPRNNNSNLIAAFEDIHLGQRDSAPLPHQDSEVGIKEVVLEQPKDEEPTVTTNFRQADLNFLSKQGRVLSPLEPDAILGQNDSLLDQSEHDQLQNLKFQISHGKKEKKLKSIKKSLRLLERFVWKKQIQQKFGSLYQMRAYVEQLDNLQEAAKQAAALKLASIGSGSNKDDSTSIDQHTAGGMSTQPTVQSRGRGRASRGGYNNGTQREDSPDLTTPKSVSLFQQTMSHTQRLYGPASPKFSNQGRGRSAGKHGGTGRGESSFSREDQDELNSKFKTIMLHEDDQFYQAYLNRGRGSPMGFFDQHHSTNRQERFQQQFEAFSSGRKFGQEDTSNFDESNKYTDTVTDAESQQPPLSNWYERRNRFLDLHLHVQGLHSRIIRTPEMMARHTQQLDQTQKERRRLSHSPLASFGPNITTKTSIRKKGRKSASMLHKIKLMKVFHPSQALDAKGRISPMRKQGDILRFPVNGFSRQSTNQKQQQQSQSQYQQLAQQQLRAQHRISGKGLQDAVEISGINHKQRKTRFLQFNYKNATAQL